jgi:HK97 family phage major capsid protein/HK97 family phage prohead protease
MPDPANYDNEADWMSACVPMRHEEHPDEDNDQSVAVCLQMWRDKAAPVDLPDRAWSTLTIKSVDTERREIEGVATTPTVDRVGDIVEPMGGKFTLPLPLLHHHKHDQPVGHVISAKATKVGIAIKAKLARIVEPGPVKDRVETAWQEIKAGLIRGLSIGFSPLEFEPLDAKDPFGGLRFSAWNWHELSLVTIPANVDARISAIKSIDQGGPAASGTETAPKSPGVSGTHSVNLKQRDRTMSKTIADQIKDLENARAAKSARMIEVMQKSVEEGRSSEPDEQEEFDTLEREVEALDADLKRFRRLEAMNKAAAQPVTKETASTIEDGAAARSGHVRITSPEPEKGIRFAQLAKCLGLAQGNRYEALQIAKSIYPGLSSLHNVLDISTKSGVVSSAAVQDFVEKGAISGAAGAMATNTSLGVGLVGDETRIFADFVEYLRAMTVIGRFGTGDYPALRRVPFRTALISQTSGATGYWVGEAAGKPVTNFDATRTHLEELKSAAIAVCTKELLQRSSPSADALVRDELARAVRERVNTTFIDPTVTAVAGVSPASIANGANTQASSGTNAAAVRADVAQLLNAFITANNPPESACFVMTSARAMQLGLMRNTLGQPEFPGINMRGGVLEGIPVMTTQLVPDAGSPSFGYVILLNTSDVWLAEDGGLTVSMSDQASLEMATTPTQHAGGVGSPDAPVGASLVSLWQTNSVGFLVEWTINWSRRRTSGVQVLSGVGWSA